MTKPILTQGAIKAAESCRQHIHAINYVYEPLEAAKEIDTILQLPELIRIAEDLINEAKRDTASSSEWQTSTVRVSRARIKELSAIIRHLKEHEI